MSAVTNESPRWAILARILKPQGRRGEVLAELQTSFPEKFAERERLFLLTDADAADGREVMLEEYWFPQGRNAGRVVLKFAGVDSIEDAETLSRLEVGVPWAERVVLDADEYYLADLDGCDVIADGVALGTVTGVDTNSTSVPLLVVHTPQGREHLLPLAKAFLVGVDVAAKRIEMKLPAGLLEINEP